MASNLVNVAERRILLTPNGLALPTSVSAAAEAGAGGFRLGAMGGIVVSLALVGIASGVGIGMAIPSSETRMASDSSNWGLDVTHTMHPREFVRMHNTLCTKTPLLLLSPNTSTPTFEHHQSPVNMGSSATPFGNVQYNEYVGLANSFCFGLATEGFPDYDFRVATSAELMAMSAVVTMPRGSFVMTYSSSDGDDADSGQIRHAIKWQTMPRSWDAEAYGFHSYDSNAPDAPPAPPLPNEIAMQTAMGAEAETENDQVRIHAYWNLAYCCSNHRYTNQDSEGAS